MAEEECANNIQKMYDKEMLTEDEKVMLKTYCDEMNNSLDEIYGLVDSCLKASKYMTLGNRAFDWAEKASPLIGRMKEITVQAVEKLYGTKKEVAEGTFGKT